MAGNNISLPEIESSFATAWIAETEVLPWKKAEKKPTIVIGSAAITTDKPAAIDISTARLLIPIRATTKP